MVGPDHDLESTLIDLTEIPLPELTDLDDSVLAHALRRIEELVATSEVSAEFDSSI
ncbi:FXSXX-COOH protein [Allonocardiopsis opalescens]|uniref:FXSXX-COOH protein n=1 Tax=Allonocardiopsis opalescens TaxID=1144618 RepID=A0A2T0Q9J4_9ACTN|nr:FXSXX-COOH protein [Allonocardiopsis opalescens]PRY00538.1 FXSXX-COOH protein [Allonocardiopsis opalescens]